MNSLPHLNIHLVGPIPWSSDDPSSRLVVGAWTDAGQSSTSHLEVRGPLHHTTSGFVEILARNAGHHDRQLLQAAVNLIPILPGYSYPDYLPGYEPSFPRLSSSSATGGAQRPSKRSPRAHQ